MTPQLISFFAPPRQLALSALIAAGLSAGLSLLHWDPLPLTALSLALGCALGGSAAHIAIQPISYWDRAWPVPQRLLLRSRILAAWLASWVPTVALLVTASALHGLGLMGEMAWARAVSSTLCVFGLVPLACATGHWLSPGPGGAPVYVATVLLLPALSLDAGLTFSGLDSKSLAALLSPALLVCVLALSLGVLLTRAWVESPELEAAPARQRASKAARPTADAPGKSGWRGVLGGPLGFFFLHSPAYALLPWINLLGLGAMTRFHYSPIMWMATTTLWVMAYSGRVLPSPLPAHLPVLRQRILGYLVAPLAVFLAWGLALQYLAPGRTTPSGFAIESYGSVWNRPPDEPYRIVAPSFVWRVSWGDPPLITSPQGMSRQPTAFAVLPGLPLNVYNPYDLRLDDDPGFVNYQVSRIMSRLLHLDVWASDIEGACHAVQLKEMSRDCLLQQFGRSYERPRMWPAVESWWLCIIVLLVLQLYTSDPFSRRKPVKWLSLFWYLPLLLGLPWALDAVGEHEARGALNLPFRFAVLLGQLTELVERAPLVSSVLGLALLFGFYRHVERRYARMEPFAARAIPPRVTRPA